MPTTSGGQGASTRASSSSSRAPQACSHSRSGCARSTRPASRSNPSQRRSLSKAACSASPGVLRVKPRSSVCTSSAPGMTARMARIASTVACTWL